MSSDTKGKASRDPLYRGDAAGRVGLPSPGASPSIVRHVLYLEGLGRDTPYLSTSESLDAASHFAGQSGRVWKTGATRLSAAMIKHWSRKDIAQLLQGKGKGRATWPSAFEVAQARRYVEEWREHLADFSEMTELGDDDLRELVDSLFERY